LLYIIRYNQIKAKKVRMEKSEKQRTIIETKNNSIATREEFISILKMVSPGTNLRNGVDGVLDAKKGGLIVIENELLSPLLDGGFRINCKFTPQKLVELAKMDGAIIVSKDLNRITYANVTLAPDNTIPSQETGTRHKAAERTAKQTSTLTIAVSERKNQIHIYYKNIKYPLKNKSEIMRRATDTLQILEKQRELFDLYLERLNHFELADELNIMQASRVIQKGKVMEKILESLEKMLIELGGDGSLLKLRIKELMRDVIKETSLVIKDYTNLSSKKTNSILETLSYDDLIDLENITLALAQNEGDKPEILKGWRFLSRTHLSEKEIETIIREMKGLRKVLNGAKEDFENLIGEEKSFILLNDIKRLKAK